MFEARTKIFVLIFLLFALLATFTVNTSGRAREDLSKPPGKAPIRKVDLTLAQDQRDQLFEQLREFADTHAFAIRISQTDPTGKHFLVQMWRKDVEVIGVDSVAPGLFLFKIGLYNTDDDHPVSLQVVDELIVDLERFIEEIPNVTFNAAAVNLQPMSLPMETNSADQPRRKILVAIERSHWSKLFIQFQKFADKWRYAIRIAPLDPSSHSFNVEMWRVDMRLVAFVDDDVDEGIVHIYFYDTDSGHLAPERFFDEEVRDLKSFIGEIPNAAVTEGN